MFNSIPENIFIQLMEFASLSIELSCEGIIYSQRVYMGSFMGVALGNILVDFHETSLLSDPVKAVYVRYVDDTFRLFNNEKEGDLFSLPLRMFTLALSLHLIYRKKKHFHRFYTCLDSFGPQRLRDLIRLNLI